MRRRVALALGLVACGPVYMKPAPPAPEAPVEPPHVAPHDGTTADERVALFDLLVATVNDGHVFSPATWDNLRPLTFDKTLPELRESFGQAVTDADLLDALARFGNALHDPHLRFRPDMPASAARAKYTLPLVIAPEWAPDHVTFVVVEAKASGVDPGDIVTSYAGTPAYELLRAHADRSNANQWAGVALDVTRWMTERPVGVGDIDDTSNVMIELRKASGGTKKVELKWSRGGWHGEPALDRAAPDYEQAHCARSLPVRAYPTYTLATHGENFCLYTSTKAPYSALPIVRFFSFDFGTPFGAEAEHDHLLRDLSALHGVKGIILDLRDNSGGNDPKWALEWFAPKPYLELATHVRKTAWLKLATEVDVTNLDEGWMKAIAKAPEGAILSRFIGCEADDCTDTRQRPTRRVLPVPVTLIVGPRCHSACDHFARVFDLNGLGPIVGEPSGADLTVLRVDHPVVFGGKRLGTLGLAVSVEYSPFTTSPVEGVPIHIDTPVLWSWAKRDVYDKELVDAAVATFAK